MPKVRVFEVGPRDGLQNQPKVLTVEQRVRAIELLAEAGVRDIEVGSFVRADRIPQLRDTGEVVKRVLPLKKKYKNLSFWAFVPNQVGLDQAIASRVDGVGLFVASSDTFCRKNVNRSQAELFAELATLIPNARKAKLKVRVYLSTITYCPYEGEIPVAKTRQAVKKLMDLGAPQVALGDTTGHSTPLQVKALLRDLLKRWPAKRFAMHFHDTRALALANAWESMQLGISTIDASIGGLGGCPYAPGAVGNLATEDLVYLLKESASLKDPIDLPRLAAASQFMELALGQKLPSKVLRTLVSA
jgi:hydroxymethylglutaryl-CoA lyase